MVWNCDQGHSAIFWIFAPGMSRGTGFGCESALIRRRVASALSRAERSEHAPAICWAVAISSLRSWRIL